MKHKIFEGDRDLSQLIRTINNLKAGSYVKQYVCIDGVYCAIIVVPDEISDMKSLGEWLKMKAEGKLPIPVPLSKPESKAREQYENDLKSLGIREALRYARPPVPDNAIDNILEGYDSQCQALLRMKEYADKLDKGIAPTPGDVDYDKAVVDETLAVLKSQLKSLAQAHKWPDEIVRPFEQMLVDYIPF